MTQTAKPDLIDHLRREQANAVRLYLQYKGYHWNVAGPLFHDLHLMFDAHATQVFETIDPLAERQRMLGATAGYTLEDVRAAASLPEEAALPASPREMIERLREAHREIILGLKRGFDRADEDGDPGTADLFAKIVQEHEKMEWFLRETLEGPSTLLDAAAASTGAVHAPTVRPSP